MTIFKIHDMHERLRLRMAIMRGHWRDGESNLNGASSHKNIILEPFSHRHVVPNPQTTKRDLHIAFFCTKNEW